MPYLVKRNVNDDACEMNRGRHAAGGDIRGRRHLNQPQKKVNTNSCIKTIYISAPAGGRVGDEFNEEGDGFVRREVERHNRVPVLVIAI